MVMNATNSGSPGSYPSFKQTQIRWLGYKEEEKTDRGGYSIGATWDNSVEFRNR